MLHVNIVGTTIVKDPPKTAQFALMNPTGDFIQLFYRIKPVKFNDGTEGESLEYFSSFNIWVGTNNNDRETYLSTRRFFAVKEG